MNSDQVQQSKIYSPGLINGQVVNFLESTKGLFFYRYEGKDYERDKEKKFLKMPLEEVINARLAYLEIHEDQEIQNATNDELKRLQADIKKRADDIIQKITTVENWRDGIYKGDLLKALATAPISRDGKITTSEKENKEIADQFFTANPTALKIRDTLRSMVKDRDYEGLHIFFEVREKPTPLGTFKTGKDVDLTAFQKVFSAKNIDATLKSLKEKGSLAVIAQVNTNKKYYPNEAPRTGVTLTKSAEL